MNQEHIRVLLLDDDDNYRRAMAALLRAPFGFHVDEAADGPAALRQVTDSGGEYDVVLIDQHLEGDADGIAILSEIRQLHPEIECIILTGYAPEDRERAIAAGAFRYVEKVAVNHNELALLIRAAAQQARMQARSRDILSRLERDEALGRILEAVASLLEADDATIALYQDEAKRWEWFHLHAADDLVAPDNEPLADEIRLGHRPVAIARLAHDPQYSALAELGFGSFAGVPVPSKGDSLGALFAYSLRPDHFDIDRLSRLQALAMQAGLALDNAETYQRTSNLAGYMAALTTTNIRLAQSTNRDELLHLAWEFVYSELRVATFYVALHDPETDEISFPAAWDDAIPIDLTPFVLTGDHSLTAHIIRTGEEHYWPTPEVKDSYCESVNIVARRQGRSCKSCLFFPLRIGGRVIGAMSVQAYEPHAFPMEFRVACRALSNQLAAALENARLMGEVRRTATDLATLQKLSIGIASSLETKTVGGQTCKAAVEFFGADHSGLVLFGDDDESGRMAAVYPPSNVVGREIPLRDVIDEQLLMREHRPLVIERVADRLTLGPLRYFLLELGIQSTLIVPVVVAERLLGSFSIDYYQPHRFSAQDVDNANMFAAQVAVALDHARYFEESMRGANMVSLLHKISDRIQAADELEDIFHMVLTGVTADFGLRFNAAAILLLEGNELVGQIGVGHFNMDKAEVAWLQDEALELNYFARYYERLQHGEFRLRRTPLDQAVRYLRLPSQQSGLLSAVIENRGLTEISEADGWYLPPSFVEAFRPAFPLVVAPLLSRDRVIGLLVADNRFTGTSVTEQLKNLLRGFADTAAVAIDNARLKQETQRQFEELRRTQAASSAQTAMLYMNMVTSQWSHRIRNQAQTIVEQVHLLHEDLQHPPEESERILYRLEMIARQAEEIKRKPINDPLHPEKGVRPEPVNALLRDTVAHLTSNWSRNGTTDRIELKLTCEVDESDCIAVNRNWFEIVIEHVLQNAAEYAGKCMQPSIVYGSRRSGNTVELFFADNGPGIPEGLREALLEAPVAKAPDQPGLGMGLFITRMIMDTYGGKIAIDANTPNGTVVTLSFPCRQS